MKEGPMTRAKQGMREKPRTKARVFELGIKNRTAPTEPDRVYPDGKVVRVGNVRYALVGNDIYVLGSPLRREERYAALEAISRGLLPAGGKKEAPALTPPIPEQQEPADKELPFIGGNTAHEEDVADRARERKFVDAESL